MATKRRKSRKTSYKKRSYKSRSTRARRNPRRKARKVRKTRSRRTARRARARRNPSRSRSIVVVSGSRRGRAKRSRRGSRRTRRNPVSLGSIKKSLSVRNISRFVAIGGGILAGTFVSKFLSTGQIPFTSTVVNVGVIAKARPVFGLVHILVGMTLNAKAKNASLKDVGVGLAAYGGFDLLMSVLSLAGVSGIPALAGMNVDLMGMNYNANRRPMVLNGSMPGPGIPNPFAGEEGEDMTQNIQNSILG